MHPLPTVMLADIGGLLLLPIGLFAIAFWVWMIVDCARNETGGTLVAWLLAILFAGIVAAPLYFLLRRLPRRRQTPLFDFAPNLYRPWYNDRRIRRQ